MIALEAGAAGGRLIFGGWGLPGREARAGGDGGSARGYMRGIAEGVRGRVNSATGEIEGLAVSDFMARAERDGGVVLPVKTALRLVASAVSAEWIGG